MNTQRFFLKAAGISLAKVAGISLALVMAFAMFAGCENTVTKTVTKEVEVPGGGGGGEVPVYPPAAAKVPTSTAELEALINDGETKPIYITRPLELTGDVTVKDGMKLVIATEEYAIRHPTGSAGLLAATYSPTSGYGKLTVAKGAVLRVERGGSVVVGNTEATANTGVLEIADGGKFHVPSGATLAVTVGSHIVVVAPAEGESALPNTGLFIDDGAKLAIVGLTANTTVSGPPATDEAPTEPVIVVSTGAPAVIDVKKETIYTDEAATTQAPTAIAEDIVDKAEDATASSPAKTEVDPAKVQVLLDTSTVKTVTYSGPTALSVNVPNGKALIITGGTTGKIAQTAAITVADGGTLEVATGATVTVSGSGSIAGAGNLVVAPGASVVVDPTSEGDTAGLNAAEGKVDISNSTGDITTSVSKIYGLSAVEEYPAGVPVNNELLTLSARKNLAKQGEGAGLVTITLGGRTDSDIPYSADPNSVYYDMFDTQEVSKILIADRAARGYSAVVIAGLVSHGSEGTIKQYNQGLNMWTQEIVTALGTTKDYDTPDVYREKTYPGGNFYPSAIGGYDIILWNGADRKTITLEITQASVNSGATQKYLIDYSGVTFTGPTGTGKTVSDPNQVSWTGAIKTVTYTGSGTLGAITGPADGTLVIAGKIANQTAPITIGTLEIAPTGELTTSGTISAGTLATIAGSLTTTAPILLATTATGGLVNSGYIGINGAVGTISTTLLTNSGVLKTEAAVTTTGTLTNDGTITTTAAINAGTLTNKQEYGIINLGQYGTIPTGGTKTNNGTINTATVTPSVLEGLVGFTGNGNVVLNPANGSSHSIAVTTSPLTLNQALEIGEYATLALGANTLSGSKNITNHGTITTTPADVAALTTLLEKVDGDVTASAITGASGTLTVPDNTDLTITTLTVGSGDLTIAVGTTDSTIAITNPVATNAGTIKTANSTVLATLLDKVTTGTVETSGSVSLDAAEVKGTTILNVASGELTVNGAITFASTGSITNGGTIDLNTAGSISDYSKVTNTSGTIKTAKDDGSTLEALLHGTTGVQGGTVQVDGTVALANGATVKGDVTLKVASGTLTVNGGTLDISAHFASNNPVNPVQLDGGELVIGSGGTLRLSMGNGTGVIPEITYGSGSLKIEKDGSVTLDHPTPETPDVTYIGTSGLYEWGTDQSGIADPYILLEGSDMTLHANLTSAQYNFIFDTVTIDEGATLTIANDQTLDISGTIIVNGTLDIGAGAGIGIVRESSTAKLQLDPGGKVNVAATGTITVYDWIAGSNIKVAVYKSNDLTTKTQATASESSPSSGDWTVTTADSGGAEASDITLGKLKITIPASSAVGGTTTWVSGAQGSLTADATDTVIVFTAHDN